MQDPSEKFKGKPKVLKAIGSKHIGIVKVPKKSTPETRRKLRREFYQCLQEGKNSYELRDAIKLMRRIAGMTQTEYARHCHVDPRSLIDYERGVGNPTMATIYALLKPFNLQLQVGLKKRE